MNEYSIQHSKLKTRMRKLFFVAILSLLTVGLFAQKVGHVNTGLLLEGMSEVKSANSQLESFQKQLIAKGQTMVKGLQTEYDAFVVEAQQGAMAPKIQQEKQAALQKKQQEIAQYEQEVQSKIMAKQEELLRPILEKVQNAITAVGKEGGYLFIFDESVPNTILFSDDSLNVMDQVKAKLGI